MTVARSTTIVPAGDGFISRGQRPRIEGENASPTLKGSNNFMTRELRPLQGRSTFVEFDPVALPPAIQFVRCADGSQPILDTVRAAHLGLP